MDFNTALTTAINHMQTRNYSIKELSHHLENLASSINAVTSVARQQRIETVIKNDQYFKMIEDICKKPNQFIKSRGEGALLSALAATYYALNKIKEKDEAFKQSVGLQITRQFAELYSELPTLNLTEKCLLATLPRTWLETLCIGLTHEYPKLSFMSRAAYKELRTKADQEFAAFRFGDLERVTSVVITPVICITQLLNKIAPAANEETLTGLIHKFHLEEMKAQGVIFRGNKYAIGTHIYDVPDDYIPQLAKFA